MGNGCSYVLCDVEYATPDPAFTIRMLLYIQYSLALHRNTMPTAQLKKLSPFLQSCATRTEVSSSALPPLRKLMQPIDDHGPPSLQASINQVIKKRHGLVLAKLQAESLLNLLDRLVSGKLNVRNIGVLHECKQI